MGDFSRETNDPRKHYSGVLMQQGRVQLDADWNEQLAIQLYRTELETRDVVGDCGVPKKTGGFQIGLTPDASDLTISPGRIYVEGLLCELDATRVLIQFMENAADRVTVENLWVDGAALAEGQWVEISAAGKANTATLRVADVDAAERALTLDGSVADFRNAGPAFIRRAATLLTQPDHPAAVLDPTGSAPARPLTSPLASPPQAALADGHYLVYLRAWKREVTALDDPRLREVALGGPDTATRLKNVWQVRLLRVTPGAGASRCGDAFAEWDELVAPPTGRLNARTRPPEDEQDPCLLPPTAGFRRLENQLYRVEVQRGGTRQTATFKWSRDNAVVRTSITSVNGPVLTVADLGRDEVLGFAGGQWVEITDEESILEGAPRQLAQIDGVDRTTREITLKTAPTGLAGRRNLQLVRWDQTDAAAGPDGVAMAAGWVDLEDGVQVEFSEGAYRAGDYWLIPARTATGEIEWPPFAVPNADPAPQPPHGVRQHFCRLALVTSAGGQLTLDDCRKPFPALTEICAEDICVDNTACDLPDVENLQDMLDRLCAARDLRWHNKHLHGWGIICGLQVECGPVHDGARRRVTVRPGYALDCEGRDIILKAPEHLDVVALAEGLQSPPGLLQNGEACLRLELDEEGHRRFRLEAYTPPRNELKELLAGTLLMDFYHDCVQPLVDFVREEFTPDADSEPALVGPARKRAITFGNLFVQYIDPVNGSHVFLSGDSTLPDAESEHTILLSSYRRLRELLQSRTFCAMFEGARPFPQYPFTNTGITTIFGRGSQTRVRINPTSTRAYAVGADHLINVYDLATNELVELLEFPGGASAVVTDVAFSADGNQLYAVATLGPADSLFAVADIVGGAHSWRTPTVVCAAHLTALATAAGVPNRAFAVGRDKGLYEINTANLSQLPTLRHEFNATGHLVISNEPQFAWATANAQPGQSVYDRVLRLNLTGERDNPVPFTFPLSTGQLARGSDDIALARASVAGGGQGLKLYMVVDRPPNTQTKHLVIFNTVSNTAGGQLVDLREETRIRLAHNPATNHLMVAYEDSNRVAVLGTADNRFVEVAFATQIKPRSIAVAPDNGHVYVLNFASNTLTKIPAAHFAQNVEQNRAFNQALVNYRADVLEAFTDLWGGLFQYLKDCFCDHLLVNCPSCDGDEKIYLACVSFREGQVYKVCNFSQRKYVKSFPTVEYWLSIFPIIPLVGRLVERICCAVFPTFFSRYRADRTTAGADGFKVAASPVSGQQYETGVMLARRTNFRAIFADQRSRVTQGQRIAREFATDAISVERAAAGAAAVSRTDLAGLRVDEARAKLEAAGIVVEDVERYEPSRAGRNLARLALAPQSLRSGDRVTLIEQDGVVRLAEEAPAYVRALREEMAETKGAVVESREVVARTEALQQEVGNLRRELAARDQVISELRDSTRLFREQAETVRSQAEALRTLREQVDSIRSVVRIPTEPERPGGPERPLEPAGGGVITRPRKKPRRGGGKKAGGGGEEPPAEEK